MCTKRTVLAILSLLLIFFLTLALALPAWASEEQEPAVTEPTAPPALSRYKKINYMGFGDHQNIYAWSMVVFNDDLYAGTWNLDRLDWIQSFFWKPERPLLYPLPYNPIPLHEVDPQPLKEKEDQNLPMIYPIEEKPPVSDGTEVWRYKWGKKWEKVVDGGLGDSGNMGLRNMIVWEDDPRGPAIYGTTINKYRGLEVWRTYDGDYWEPVVGQDAQVRNGFGLGPQNESGRGMGVFKDHLYVGAMKANGGELYRTPDGVEWTRVFCGDEKEDPENPGNPRSVSSLCTFDDGSEEGEALFMGTWRHEGFKVFKSYDGVEFDEVATDGINDENNGGVFKLIPFQGRLWLITYNIVDGFDVYASREGKPIESNNDWELIVSNGFTTRWNVYAWNAEVYDNGQEERLYIGTCNVPMGFHLYSVTPDGRWAVEVGEADSYPVHTGQEPRRPGIRTFLNYGVRSMAVLPGKCPWENDELVLGTAGILKPLVVFTAD